MGNCCMHDRTQFPQAAKLEKSKSSSKLISQKLTFYANIENDYELLKFLGSSGFGRVYLGRNKKTEERVAIKCFNKDMMGNKLDIAYGEIELLMKTDHPNIIKLYGVYEDSKIIYLVMELCEGNTLLLYIEDRKSRCMDYGENIIAKYMKKVFLVLTYLHSHNVCHGDVQPSNFILTRKDNKSELKLINFGLSLKLIGKLGITDQTGTSQFMAPENIEGQYGLESDVWSAGVVMYFLISGTYPFDGLNRATILNKITYKKLKFKGHEWKNVRSEAKELLDKLLTKDSSHRITAAEALEDRWFEVCKLNKTDLKASIDNITSIKVYSVTTNLKREALAWMVKHFQSAKVEDLNELFYKLDIDKTGNISYQNFCITLNQAGVKLKKKELKDLFNKIDISGDGLINYTEFLSAILSSRNQVSEALATQAFQEFDINRDGFIVEQELVEAFRKTGRDSIEDKAWLKEIGVVQDGKIDIEEFKIMIFGEKRES